MHVLWRCLVFLKQLTLLVLLDAQQRARFFAFRAPLFNLLKLVLCIFTLLTGRDRMRFDGGNKRSFCGFPLSLKLFHSLLCGVEHLVQLGFALLDGAIGGQYHTHGLFVQQIIRLKLCRSRAFLICGLQSFFHFGRARGDFIIHRREHCDGFIDSTLNIFHVAFSRAQSPFECIKGVLFYFHRCLENVCLVHLRFEFASCPSRLWLSIESAFNREFEHLRNQSTQASTSAQIEWFSIGSDKIYALHASKLQSLRIFFAFGIRAAARRIL